MSSYYPGFPPPCSVPATAAKNDSPQEKSTSLPVPPARPSPPSHVAWQDAMDRAGFRRCQRKTPVPDQATVQDQELNRASMEESALACKCEQGRPGRCDFPHEPTYVGEDSSGRYAKHGDPANLEWRYRMMNNWNPNRSSQPKCRYASSFYRWGTRPCDDGWGKALYEHYHLYGKQSMETERREFILEKYRQRHLYEQRPKSPVLRLSLCQLSGNRYWEVARPEQQPQQPEPEPREEKRPSVSLCVCVGISGRPVLLGKEKMVCNGALDETWEPSVVFTICERCGYVRK
jgi:hypothetical protein